MAVIAIAAKGALEGLPAHLVRVSPPGGARAGCTYPGWLGTARDEVAGAQDIEAAPALRVQPRAVEDRAPGALVASILYHCDLTLQTKVIAVGAILVFCEGKNNTA